MVRAAFTASDLAYPPHAATCSSVGGGIVAICRGKPGVAGGLSHCGVAKSQLLISNPNRRNDQGFLVSGLAFLISMKTFKPANLSADMGFVRRALPFH